MERIIRKIKSYLLTRQSHNQRHSTELYEEAKLENILIKLMSTVVPRFSNLSVEEHFGL